MTRLKVEGLGCMVYGLGVRVINLKPETILLPYGGRSGGGLKQETLLVVGWNRK